ncbi:MAG: LysR family transcriptional regulator [Woeseiaceae bacterium]|nr:LysR family transcriptional regulator [Woeseiaceae bacterium]
MDRFEDLQAFVAVVETGSFTAAAERLDAAKSAVSRRVAGLEQRLGVQLIRRTTRRLDITDSGHSFYEHSARILADLDEAESAVRQQHGRLHGVLRIALPLSFGIRHMHEPIANFSKRHPDVTFELDLNDRRIDLLEEGLDVALRIGRLRDSSLIARRLFDVRAVVCASPGYIARNGRPETPGDLVNHACMVYSNIADPDRWVCEDRDGNEISIRVPAFMRCNSGDLLIEAASRDLGIIVTPTFIAADAISSGEVEPLLTEYRWPETPAYAVYPPTRHLSYRVRAFIDYLADYFSGEPSWDSDCDRVLNASNT